MLGLSNKIRQDLKFEVSILRQVELNISQIKTSIVIQVSDGFLVCVG